MREERDGQSLYEATIAIALFVAFVSVGVQFLSSMLMTLERTRTIEDAAVYAEDTFEALRSIAHEEWDSMIDGVYGLTASDGGWKLYPIPDTRNGITRSITIAPVERDAACVVVASGTLDPRAKRVSVTTSWSGRFGAHERTFVTHLTDWRTGAPTCGGQAAQFVIHVTASCIDTESKEMRGIRIENAGSAAVVLDTLQLEWYYPDQTSPGNLRIVTINGATHWHATASGGWSPSGSQPSGAVLNILDLTIPPGTTYDIDRFRFDTKLDGAQFTVTARMSDASSSSVTTPSFVPACDG